MKVDHLDIEHIDALLAGIIRRSRECINACDRAALIRERDGSYPVADMDAFISNTRASHEDLNLSINRLIAALHPE